MKLAKNHYQLRKDVESLRFINEQTGYNYDIREIVKRKNRNLFLDLKGGLAKESLTIASILAPPGIGTILGLIVGNSCFQGYIPQTPRLLIGSFGGMAMGWALRYVTLGSWDKAEDTINRANAYKKSYDEGGLEKMQREGLRFDRF